ncbi:MAG: hypothetical protein IPM98_08980 [Lewinellaceae bacterium]|nr:hypothetical protein [Lewinellaceae bacterium]
MYPTRIFILLLLAGSIAACKKDVDIPPELRPDDFWVRCTIVDNTGQERLFEHRGGDKATLPPGVTFQLAYLSEGVISDSIRRAWSGLGSWPFPTPFYLSLSHPDRVTDPFTPAEWQAEDYADVLFPGKTFRFGAAPGEAALGIADFPDGAWSFKTMDSNGPDSYVRVLEVSDYGIPELGTPFFGKKPDSSFSPRCRTAMVRSGPCATARRYCFFAISNFKKISQCKFHTCSLLPCLV